MRKLFFSTWSLSRVRSLFLMSLSFVFYSWPCTSHIYRIILNSFFFFFLNRNEKREMQEMQEELEDLRECGLGSCKPSFLQSCANIKVSSCVLISSKIILHVIVVISKNLSQFTWVRLLKENGSKPCAVLCLLLERLLDNFTKKIYLITRISGDMRK